MIVNNEASPPQRSKGHTAASATILLMASALLSGLLGLVRIKYINSLFGAGPEQDAYRAAFALPDLLAYFLIGGAASISLITILNRYREAGDEAGADHALSVILSTMLVVLGWALCLLKSSRRSMCGWLTRAFETMRCGRRCVRP